MGASGGGGVWVRSKVSYFQSRQGFAQRRKIMQRDLDIANQAQRDKTIGAPFRVQALQKAQALRCVDKTETAAGLCGGVAQHL